MKEALAELMKILVFLFLLSCLVFACSTQEAIGADRAFIEKEVRKLAPAHNLDPDLVLAIIEVESNFNVNAVGALGEVGLLQLRPEFHEGVALGSVKHNLRVGIRYLAYVRSRCTPVYGSAWYICHNTGPYRKTKIKRPKEFPYYVKVSAAYQARRGLLYAQKK